MERGPHATIFHQRPWIEVLTQVHGMDFFPGGIYQQGELYGIIPLFIMKRGIFRTCGSPLGFSGSATPYLGPIVEDNLVPETLEALERWLRQNRIDYAEIASLRHSDGEMWGHYGYRFAPRLTVWMNLPADPRDILKSATKGCRSSVKKAQASGVVVEDLEDLSFLAEYLQMAAEVYRKSHRAPPSGARYYETLWSVLRPLGLLRVKRARLGEKTIAMSMFLVDGKAGRGYYLDGVSLSEYSSLGANNLIQFSFIQEMVAQGFTEYDMLGANHEGIRRFKLSFGGSLRAYDYAYRPCNLTAAIARETYRVLAPKARQVRQHWNSFCGT